MSRCLLIINRGAGASQRGIDPAAACRIVEEAFRAAGHEIRSQLVAPESIEDALRGAVAEKPERVIVGGGDGTVSTAARVLGGSGIALGVLPMGTFNLAARDFGVPLELEAAAGFLATADALAIDVMDVAGRACLCTTILGFYPEYSDLFEKREEHRGNWLKKTFHVLSQMWGTYRLARPLRLRWRAGNEVGSARTKFASFVPGRYREQPGLIPARADFTSGRLSAYIGLHETPASALRGILDYTLGRQELDPDLTVFQTPALTLWNGCHHHVKVMLDGEILRLRLPLELRILPRHLVVLIRLPEDPS